MIIESQIIHELAKSRIHPEPVEGYIPSLSRDEVRTMLTPGMTA